MKVGKRPLVPDNKRRRGYIFIYIYGDGEDGEWRRRRRRRRRRRKRRKRRRKRRRRRRRRRADWLWTRSQRFLLKVVYHVFDCERQTKAEEERGGQTPRLKETDPDPDPETEDRTTRSTPSSPSSWILLRPASWSPVRWGVITLSGQTGLFADDGWSSGRFGSDPESVLVSLLVHNCIIK